MGHNRDRYYADQKPCDLAKSASKIAEDCFLVSVDPVSKRQCTRDEDKCGYPPLALNKPQVGAYQEQGVSFNMY